METRWAEMSSYGREKSGEDKLCGRRSSDDQQLGRL